MSVFVFREMDESKAWAHLYEKEEGVLKALGNRYAFLTIDRHNNSIGDGGNYIMYFDQGLPILTGLVFRDDANWSIIQVVVFNENISKLMVKG